jgi:hypothetical protein
MRWLVLAACCVAAAAGAPPARAATVTPKCFSPTPVTPTDCQSWHNQPVSVMWETTGFRQNCADLLAYKKEGVSTVSCTVTDGSSTTTGSVTLRIDLTPPAITGATPGRAPDVNGWWNHPVTFSFAGNDSLSSIASCDTVTYSGPGGPGAVVTGGCHDVAGNYGVASFPLNFDSTSPAFNAVRAVPESQSATISWNASDAVRAQVTRTVGVQGSAARVVYSGPANHFTDSGIANGRVYAYRITVFDEADNSASRTVHAKPMISLGLKPRRDARLTEPPRLRWPIVKHADYYNVQLWRGRQKLLTVWPTNAQMTLHRVMRLRGLKVRLRAGHYRWYVWPGYGSRAAHRYGSFIGQSSFVLTR